MGDGLCYDLMYFSPLDSSVDPSRAISRIDRWMRETGDLELWLFSVQSTGMDMYGVEIE